MQRLTGNRRMGRLLTAALVLGLALAVVSLGSTAVPAAQAQGQTGTSSQDLPMNPPRLANAPGSAPAAQPYIPNKAAKKAVVVKSWDGCGGWDVWRDLNVNWSHFGTVPVSIDYSNTALCSNTSTITLSALQATHAHTVIISDPSGANIPYSASEISAIQQYAKAGHNVFGSYLVLYWGVDNRGLAVLFGLDPKAAYGGGTNSTNLTYNELAPTSFLFNGIGNPYVSSAFFPYSQTPADGIWNKGNRGLSKYKAETPDKGAVILQYSGPGYRAVWITSMPEDNSSTADEQFIYNVLSH